MPNRRREGARPDAAPPIDVDTVEDDAFALAEDYPPFESDWHAHDKHQILFAARGTAVLTVDGARWMLPPQRAAWIRAKTRHRVASATGIQLRTIYFARAFVSDAPAALCSVFAVTPLAREMIAFATRWGPARNDRKRTRPRAAPRPGETGTREAFFRAFAGLSCEWIDEGPALVLPLAETPELARAMAYVGANLATATLDDAAKASGTSARTLSRRFDEEARMPFRTYMQTARIMRAMELLAEARASVTRVGYEVGFQSPGAFTTAFSSRCGETPSAYAARIRQPR
jgi:AraC-like DNA-binding protein